PDRSPHLLVDTDLAAQALHQGHKLGQLLRAVHLAGPPGRQPVRNLFDGAGIVIVTGMVMPGMVVSRMVVAGMVCRMTVQRLEAGALQPVFPLMSQLVAGHLQRLPSGGPVDDVDVAVMSILPD